MRARRALELRRTLSVVLAAACLGTAALVAAPAGASGGAQDPPGWADPGGGAWVAFTLQNPIATPIGRSGNYEPVIVERSMNGIADLDAAFPGWPQRDTDNDTIPDERGWPDSFSGGGVTLQRVEWCVATASSCAYTVVDPGTFWFAGGTPLASDGITPDYSVFPSEQTVQKPPPAQIVATLTYNKGAPGELGKLVLDGSGSTDPLGGTLTFSWTITRQADAKIWTGSGTTLTQAIDEAGVYCIDLSVVSSVDGASQPAGQQCVTFADTEVPAKAPTPGTGGTIGVPTGGGGQQVATVVFAKPAPRRTTFGLGSAASAPTVVWLWRPEWYAGSDPAQKAPRTTSQPKTAGKKEIVVNRGPGADGASAGPWLAGLAAFGLLGAGFLVSRRRRLRLEP